MQCMNYNQLLGTAKAQGFTQKQLAHAAGITESTMSLKLKGRYPFTSDEIRSIVEYLHIPPAEIGAYFFTPKV